MTPSHRQGFTLVELMIYLVIASLVLGAVVKLIVNQNRTYADQRALMDVRETLRSGSALLAWEVRHAAVANSPFAAIAAQSLTLRSVQGMGIVCAKGSVSAPYFRVGLWNTSGDIEATVDDTALIWVGPKQLWRKIKIHQVGTPVALPLGVANCTWTGKSIPPTLVVELTAAQKNDSSDIFVGATFRSFRAVTYSEMSSGGRYWLGRQVGAGTNDQLTGPLIAPGANGGLTFSYYDTLGVATANPAAVGSVLFTLRAQSLKSYRNPNSGVVGYRQDSLTTKVTLRRR